MGCTWPELARLTLATSLVRDLGIHDFDVIQKLIAGDVENETENGKMKLQTQAVLQLILLQSMTSSKEMHKLDTRYKEIYEDCRRKRWNKRRKNLKNVVLECDKSKINQEKK